MRKNATALILAPAFAVSLLSVTAAPVLALPTLFEFGINIDATTTCGAGLPGCTSTGVSDLSGVAGVNDSGFNYTTGIGNIGVSLSGAGNHYASLFLDIEFTDTNVFFDEYGSATGVAAAGQTWEIDEPGFLFGDIDANFLAGTLDNANGVPVGQPDDPSMALAWAFSLLAGEVAMINFSTSSSAPGSGFFLTQTDPGSSESIYFSSSLTIERDAEIPVPASLALIGIGLAGLGWSRRKKV